MKKLRRTGIRKYPKSKMIQILRREIIDKHATEQSSFVFRQFGQGNNFPFLGLGE